MKRKTGRSKLVFNKKTKTIDIVRSDPMDGIRKVKREGWMWVGKKDEASYPARTNSYLYDSESEAQEASQYWSGFRLAHIEWEEEE